VSASSSLEKMEEGYLEVLGGMVSLGDINRGLFFEKGMQR